MNGGYKVSEKNKNYKNNNFTKEIKFTKEEKNNKENIENDENDENYKKIMQEFLDNIINESKNEIQIEKKRMEKII